MDHFIKGNFVSLPESTLDSVEWKGLTAATRCVYTTMLKRYQRKGDPTDGEVVWSQVELVEQSGIPLRTVNRCILDLREKEWIWVMEPGGRWAKGTTYKINPVYSDGVK